MHHVHTYIHYIVYNFILYFLTTNDIYIYYIIDLKRKMTTSARLAESNSAATRLGDIADKKFHMKSAYYEKKLKLMEENNEILKNLGTVLTTFVQKSLKP